LRGCAASISLLRACRPNRRTHSAPAPRLCRIPYLPRAQRPQPASFSVTDLGPATVTCQMASPCFTASSRDWDFPGVTWVGPIEEVVEATPRWRARRPRAGSRTNAASLCVTQTRCLALLVVIETTWCGLFGTGGALHWSDRTVDRLPCARRAPCGPPRPHPRHGPLPDQSRRAFCLLLSRLHCVWRTQGKREREEE